MGRGGSSISRTTRSDTSPRSPRGSSRSASTGKGAGARADRLLGRREIRDLLERHGLRPKTSLGQHFLADPNTIRKIVRVAGVRPGEHIIEVGAGVGSLTIGLAEANARVIAVEQDRALAAGLEESTAGLGRLQLVWGDAMEVDYVPLLGGRPARVISNLPYQIATPLVLRFLAEVPLVSELIVMVQREVGERLVAEPGDGAYGGVSAKVAYFADARIEFGVSRRVFLPEPEVESVVVRLARRERPPVSGLRERIFAVIDAGFAVRRKTIRNALRASGLDATRVSEALAAAGVDEGARAEVLSLEDFAAIARVLRVPEVRG